MPLLSRYVGLPQDSHQQRHSDIRLMRIWNTNIEITSRHELMFASREGAIESEVSETLDELPPRSGCQFPHAARRALRSYLRAVGMNCCLRTFRRSHSSSTSYNSARHSFLVAPCAHTPWNPAMVPTYGKGSSIFSIFAFSITTLTYSVNMCPLYHTWS